MDIEITREFVTVIGKVKKLFQRNKPQGSVHSGEFMMLGAISHCMEDILERNPDAPGVMVSELVERTHSSKSAASKMLRTLEEKGYTERVTDKKDRRVVYVKLSKSGEQILQNAFEHLQNFADKTLKKLGEEDGREFVRILNKFYQILYDEMKEQHCEEHREHKNLQKTE
jgi:DNA-binding MarR family transcriptional regulator